MVSQGIHSAQRSLDVLASTYLSFAALDADSALLCQVRRTLEAAWPDLRNNQPGGFQLYGFDFMVDTDYRTWLLEVNGAPAAADKLRNGIAQSIVVLSIDSRFPPPPDWGLEGCGARHGFEEICSISSLDRRSGYR